MFNAMCPADLAASGSYALWQGNLCSGTEAGGSTTTTRFWTPFFWVLGIWCMFFGRAIRGKSPHDLVGLFNLWVRSGEKAAKVV